MLDWKLYKMMNLLKSSLLLCLGLLLAACGQDGGQARADEGVAAAPAQTYNWKLVTAWPKNFPGLGRAPESFAQ